MSTKNNTGSVVIHDDINTYDKKTNVIIATPQQPTKETLELINAIGIEAYNALLTIEHLKYENSLEDAKKPHVMFQIITGFISVFITKDPNHMHYNIVRTAINEIDPTLLNDNSVIDETVREFIKQCEKFKVKLLASGCPKKFKKILAEYLGICKQEIIKNEYYNESALEIISLPFNDQELESTFEDNGLFIWDKALLSSVHNTGEKGAENAKDGKLHRKNRLKKFKHNKENPLGFSISNIRKTIYRP